VLATEQLMFLNKLIGCTIDITVKLILFLTFIYQIDVSYFLSSTYKLLLCDSAQFHQNDTSWRRVDTFLRKTSVDIETSI